MKLRVSSILLLFICCFTFISNVDAGVCEGYAVSLSYGTCEGATSVEISSPEYLGKTHGSYFLRAGYVATNAKGDGMAFCLDPGLVRPTTSLGVIRELDNSDTSGGEGSGGYYDDGIYRMYQLFYNDLLAQSNGGGLNDTFVNRIRSYFQNAIRVWTYRNGFDYLAPESATYQIDAPHFKTCAHYIDSSVKGGTKYSVSECYGGHKGDVQRYYNAVGEKYIWENPLSISTDSKVVDVDGKKYYRYEFNIKFANDKYSFFDGNYSKGIQYRDINLGEAFFSLDDLLVNGVSCSNGNTCYNYSGGGVVSEGTERQFIVELTEEQYNEFARKSGDDSVSVTMKYAYQHPLNTENLYVARYDLKNTFQRMLVIQNYVHYDTISIGKEPEKTKCEHTVDGYINKSGDKVDTLEQFISSCGCSAVDKSLLNDGDLTNYNSFCFDNVVNESYSGEIGVCTSNGDDTPPDDVLNGASADNNYDSYNLGYHKETTINNYCTEKCDENIEINDLKGKYTTKAGMYFEFVKYPNLIANKKCEVEIDYTKWKEDYVKNLNDLKDAYNDWQRAVALKGSEKISESNDCDCSSTSTGEVCYKKTYSYSAETYSGVSVNGTSLSEKSYTIVMGLNESRTSCGSSIDWGVDTKLKEFRNQASKATAISNLKTDLKVCNTRLFGTTDENFYDFGQKLNYYYYQTYSDSNGNKLVRNDERARLGGVDDSEFNVSQTLNGSSNEKKETAGGDVTYSTLTEEGISNESIYTYNENIYRSVEYDVDYTYPKRKKYVEIFTGNVKYSPRDGETILLGYGYDTSVSAIAKSDNDTYYSFSKLGAGDNKIFNNFRTGNEIIRKCSYEITNDIITGCEDATCESDSKLNIIYRVVDDDNIDPNDRLSTGSGFKNWDNTKGQKVKDAIENDDTYNPDNLEYSFTLDSATIKKIREYNANCDAKGNCDPISYSSTNESYSMLECNSAGNECTSKFISELYKSDGEFGSNVATNIDGRNKWKYLIYNDTDGKWSIEEKTSLGDGMFESLITQYKSLGVDVIP